MRGDFSRIRFNPGKHYTSVLQQQGRVALDADINEGAAIAAHIQRTEAADIIGPFGGPSAAPGFAISVTGNSLAIGAGRYYVHGILCENPAAGTYDAQPFLIDPTPSAADLLLDLSAGKSTSLQVYLEVWQRLVTALDDPCLREPALGQADTTVRLQTVTRVIAVPVAAPPSPSRSTIINRAGLLPDLRRFVTIDNDTPLLRSEVSTLASAPSLTNSLSAAPKAAGCCSTMYKSLALAGSTGRLTAQTSGATDDCSCDPTPSAGYRGLENQLYRIEIHHGGSETTATFKWSRENGSVATSVTGLSGANVRVASLGPDANLGFSPGQWVEISDDRDLFGAPPNQPGDLFQVTATTPENLTVTLSQPASAVDSARNARLRRWENSGPSATSVGIPLAPGTWITLENGVEIQFAPGSYASGDYWVIPARTATGNIEWPPCGGDGAAFQPPHSLEVLRAPLACIHWDGQSQAAVVEDCRRIFPALTDVTANTAKSLHVASINWSNDDVITLDQLVARSLVVTLDAPPTSTIDASNFAVTLEAATGHQADFGRFPGTPFRPTVLRSLTAIDAQIQVNGATITWLLPFANTSQVQLQTVLFLNALLLLGAPFRDWGRMRVKLLGNAIFSGTGSDTLYLDGASLAITSTKADGKTPRLDLQLPSGKEEQFSNFDSWFFVAPTLALTAFTVDPSAVRVTPNPDGSITVARTGNDNQTPVIPQGTLTVNYPAIAATPVALVLTGTTGVGTIASVPATAMIPINQTSVSFPISITGNPGLSPSGAPLTLSFTITATLTSAVGGTSVLTATFTVLGSAPIIP